MNRVTSCTALLFALILALLFHPQHSNDVLSSHGNTLLLTAHPDDECMFFAPTIQALTGTGTSIHSLCLSTGDADGLGLTRREELSRSLDILGITKDKRWIVDHPDLQDNFTAHWDPETMAQVIYPYITLHNISTVLTFDAGGISGHPNHRSLPEGLTHLLRSHEFVNLPTLYTLVTRPILSKYTGILAPLSSKFVLSQDRIFPFLHAPLNQLRRALQLATESNSKMQVVHVSGLPEYLTALRAMRAHASQLVWFRWLYVLFSRYMWVNEWAELPIDAM